jgi:quinone-modifying oxidoreductase, subunit QmoC
MAEAAWVEPDLEFKREILGLGGHDLTACYQCGTCSVVCPLSTEDMPFPRKEMVWVQWGLKDKLLADPAIWVCHQCSHCNVYCPRDAKPADVMAALREYSIEHYAVPGFMAKALGEPKYLPLLFALPASILLVVLAGLGHLSSLPEGPVVFSKFMPIKIIEVIYTLCVGAAVIAGIAGGVRYWNAMRGSATNGANGSGPMGSLLPSVFDIFSHSRFRTCEDVVGTRPTYKSHLHKTHLAIFYGFIGLLITTVSVGIGIYVFDYPTPWPLWHPVKILGNGSGVVLLAACAVFFYRRIEDGKKAGKSTYTDWLFLGVLSLTALTGFFSEILRLVGIPALAYWTYFVHLVFVFFLLVYVPYSKFGHVFYRFSAMLYAAARAKSAHDARVLEVPSSAATPH